MNSPDKAATPISCEAIRYSDGQPCPHPAKYLVPYDSSIVCGIHRRAFLRCIPIAELENTDSPVSP